MESPASASGDHCLNVGCVAEALLALLPPHSTSYSRRAATLAALMTSVRSRRGFQVKCQAWLVEARLKERALTRSVERRESDHGEGQPFAVQQLLRSSRFAPPGQRSSAHTTGGSKGKAYPAGEPWEGERTRLAVDIIKEFGPCRISRRAIQSFGSWPD